MSLRYPPSAGDLVVVDDTDDLGHVVEVEWTSDGRFVFGVWVEFWSDGAVFRCNPGELTLVQRRVQCPQP